jgi:hypothetical protein
VFPTDSSRPEFEFGHVGQSLDAHKPHKQVVTFTMKFYSPPEERSGQAIIAARFPSRRRKQVAAAASSGDSAGQVALRIRQVMRQYRKAGIFLMGEGLLTLHSGQPDINFVFKFSDNDSRGTVMSMRKNVDLVTTLH